MTKKKRANRFFDKNLIVKHSNHTKALVAIVGNYYGYNIEDLKKRNRLRERVFARQMMFYFLKNKTQLTESSIAELFDLDRTTIHYGIKVIRNLSNNDKKTKNDIAFLDEDIDKRIGNNREINRNNNPKNHIDLNNIISLVYDTKKSITFSGFSESKINEIADKLGWENFNKVRFNNTGIAIIKEVSNETVQEEFAENDDKNNRERIED
jgi:hypothetical protein